jgi:hypothetical protein
MAARIINDTKRKSAKVLVGEKIRGSISALSYSLKIELEVAL